MTIAPKVEPLLSIVVVTWNAKKYVEECLESIAGEERQGTEIIVVDNASSDGTPELVKQKFPQLKLIRNPQNLGFAKATNIGIRAAAGKYLALINSDVTVPQECIGALLRFMEAEPTVGLVGPQMMGPTGAVRRSCMRFPSLTNSAARSVGLDRSPILSGLLGGQMMSDFRHDQVADVDVLNGWFWMVRRTALDEVGLLDERFFIYGEDLDWCYRFHKAGWRLVFNPNARAVHFGGASSSAEPVRFYLEMQRANLQFWSKHHSVAASLINRALVFLQHVLRVIGHALAYVLHRSDRQTLEAKIRRSRAMLLWMISPQALFIDKKQHSVFLATQDR